MDSQQPLQPNPTKRATRLAWQAAGLFFVALGLIGIPLPLLPTTPFLLLALFCFARSSPRLHAWLLHHPRLGPTLRAWERHRAIPRRAKVLAGAMMAASLVLSLLLAVPGYAIALQALALAGAAAYVFTRPSPPPEGRHASAGYQPHSGRVCPDGGGETGSSRQSGQTAGQESSMTEVTRNPATGRFELNVDGHTAFIDYRDAGDRLVLLHTEVPQDLGGRGIGTSLARGALDLVRREGRQVELRCDFLSSFVARNPAYRDLLADPGR